MALLEVSSLQRYGQRMKAKITYKIERRTDPWTNADTMVHCLTRVTIPEYGDSRSEPVALFNLDSEAEAFTGHVLICAKNGEAPIEIDPAEADVIEKILKLRER